MDRKDAADNSMLLTNTDVRIGVGFVIALLLVHVFPFVQALSACTAVIMCTQDNGKVTWKSSLTRVEGVLIGGVCALLVVILDHYIGNSYVFMLLCGAGILLNLLCCKLAKMPGIVARVSCITFSLVALALQGDARIKYALLRLLGTAVGALLSLLLSWIWDKIDSGKK